MALPQSSIAGLPMGAVLEALPEEGVISVGEICDRVEHPRVVETLQVLTEQRLVEITEPDGEMLVEPSPAAAVKLTPDGEISRDLQMSAPERAFELSAEGPRPAPQSRPEE